MSVQNIARTDVVTARPDDGIAQIVERMRDEGVGSVVVVREDEPVGIVTDRQIALATIDRNIDRLTAEDLTTEDLVTVGADANVFQLVKTLSDEGVRRVPIVDDEGSLVGIVSMDDLLVVFASEFGKLGDLAEKQSPRF